MSEDIGAVEKIKKFVEGFFQGFFESDTGKEIKRVGIKMARHAVKGLEEYLGELEEEQGL